MEKGANATSIIILDACRNNPFARAWTRSAESRGLAPIYAPRGTLIAHATSPGQVVSDGKGRYGAYTDALLKHLATPEDILWLEDDDYKPEPGTIPMREKLTHDQLVVTPI